MSKLLYFFKQKNLTADNFLLIKQFIKQYVILQVHFEKIWQFEFGKITVRKRIKEYIRSLKRAVFFAFKQEIKQDLSKMIEFAYKIWYNNSGDDNYV